MKPVSKKHLQIIKQYTRRRGFGEPVVEWTTIHGNLNCLKSNAHNHLETVNNSTKQHRQRAAQIARLHEAVKSLSYDTRETLAGFLAMARTSKTKGEVVLTDGRLVDDFCAAVAMARKSTGKRRTARGGGHIAEVRREFVRGAATLYLMAGGEKIGANDESLFMGWVTLIQATCAIPLNDYGSFRRAIREEIGATEAERAEWTKKKLSLITRNKGAN